MILINNMKSDGSKTELQKEINEFFSDMQNKTSNGIKKIKKLAMNKKISLKPFKKYFCKYCLAPFSGNEKARIKNGTKSIECKDCKKISRWKIK